MENKILSITEEIPRPTKLVDGIYLGVWGGYNIIVNHREKRYSMKTENGVRGSNIKVVVTIENGIATFNELSN